jgi:3alpha(or 20beta)-hydroxysteroid dehydrogenase
LCFALLETDDDPDVKSRLRDRAFIANDSYVLKGTFMKAPLDGKAVIVSGAAHGIGAAEARAICGAGGKVVVGDILDSEGQAFVETLEMEFGLGSAIYVHLDVRSAAAWESAVTAAERSFGHLYGLVNNAGVPARSSIDDTTEEEWNRTIDVDLKGTWLGMKAAIPAMRRSGRGGSIVNTSSHYGMVASGRAATYHTAKGAVAMLTKAAAAEYAHENIRVNSIHPGLTDTVRIASLPAPWKTELMAQVPLKRIADPAEIGSVVVFLLSEYSTYMTGSPVVVDGGLTAI